MNRVAIVFLIIFNIVLATYYGVHMYHIFMELYGHPHTTGEEEGHFTDNEFRKLDKCMMYCGRFDQISFFLKFSS